MHEKEANGPTTDIIYRDSLSNIKSIVQSNEGEGASDELQQLIEDLVKNYEQKQITSFPTIIICRIAELITPDPYPDISCLNGLELILLSVLETVNEKIKDDGLISRTDYHVCVTVCYLLINARYIRQKTILDLLELMKNNKFTELIEYALKCILLQQGYETDVFMECLTYVKKIDLKQLDAISKKTLYKVLIDIIEHSDTANHFIDGLQETIKKIIQDIDDDNYVNFIIEILVSLSKIGNENIDLQILNILGAKIMDPQNLSRTLKISITLIIKNAYNVIKDDIFSTNTWIIEFIIYIITEYSIDVFLIIIEPFSGLVKYVADNKRDDIMQKIDLEEVVSFAKISKNDKDLNTEANKLLDVFIHEMENFISIDD